ncbi:MAG TPA: hypothetical protein VLM38_15925 [Blastocatellia bacterium]|nr:hypothetical protein [Blastocatellia bacterium]
MNGKEVSFHRLAELELNEAAAYYQLEKPGLGARFLKEVDRCIELSSNIPKPEQSFLVMCAVG